MAVKKKFPYRSALVACNGGCHVQEGQSCENGCIGCGICVSVCPFQAIAINENGVAEVDEAKCVACGKCVRECPKGALSMSMEFPHVAPVKTRQVESKPEPTPEELAAEAAKKADREARIAAAKAAKAAQEAESAKE